jgi:hypothetical protein
VCDAEGDYLLIVKGNQPQLHRDIATLFASRADLALSAASLPAWDMRTAAAEECGHGRRERRRVVASSELNEYLGWPGVGQVFMVERWWQERGEEKQAVRYGITSLPPDVADAARMLVLVRGHWQIENGLHHVKDVTLGEDRSTIHKGNGPSNMRSCAIPWSACCTGRSGARSPRGYATTAATPGKPSPSSAFRSPRMQKP